MQKILGIILFLFISYSFNLLAQDIDISVQLKQIEAGRIEKVKKDLAELKQNHPNSPSVLYLEALLTEDGKEALGKYNAVVENYPKSKYADAALFEIYSYYYSQGIYRMADGYLQQLKDTYPNSPFIKLAEQNDDSEGFPVTPKKVTFKKDSLTADPVLTNVPNQDRSSNKDYKYTIQAGAFLSLSNARNLQKSFREDGYFSDIKEKNIGGSILNVVTVGQFVTELEARAELSVINKNFNLNGRVVSIK